MNFFTTKSTITAFTIFIATLTLTNIAQAACNSIATGGTDASIEIILDQHIALGSLTRPDTGTKTVIIGSDGSKTLPAELNVGTNNPDIFNPAEATVTGTANCVFQITVNIITGNLSDVTLAAAVGYTSLTSTSNGAKGTLPASEAFEFTIGVSDTIYSDTTPVGGTFNVRVDYSDL